LDGWAALSNRLLLLQEMVIGLSKLEVAGVLEHVRGGVGWVFDRAQLHVLSPGELEKPPLISRGRTRLEPFGEVYLAYFAGPPEPLYLALSGPSLADPQEFRLAALFFEHLLAALEAAGYREELAKQAHTDWLTGLANRRSFERALREPLPPEGALGLLEFQHAAAGVQGQADSDRVIKRFGQAVREALPEGGQAFRVGDYRVALLLMEPEIAPFEAALRGTKVPFASAWAFGGEGAALFERVKAQLEAQLTPVEVRTASPVGRGEVPLRSLVHVHSGFEQIKLAYQETATLWNVKSPVHLILDGPYGYALDCFSDELRPALILTDSPSRAYIRDLADLKPEGLIVGQVSERELFEALERVLLGERFYQGPPLEEDTLYPREREVWRLVVRGLTNAQIAERLKITEKTVANYVTSLQEKLHLNNRVELVLHYLGKLQASPAE